MIHATEKMTPAIAPAHTPASTTIRSEPSSTSRAIGVCDAAMKTKIVEWSMRRRSGRQRGSQRQR